LISRYAIKLWGKIMSQTEVLIIESRSPADHFDGRHEGRILQQILHLEGVRSKYFEVLDKNYLEKALKKAENNNVKYVHLSCHGLDHGFELSDGTFISWKDFDEIAWPLLKDKCLVFSSCCVGNGVEALFEYHKTFCNAIIAPTKTITWSEGVVAYSAFYHKATAPDTSTKSDVRLMNAIVGAGTFSLIESPTKNTTYAIGA
jgi:hypothetical protein